MSAGRILLAEDYFLVADLCRSMLEDGGYEVLGPAATVRAALEIVETERPDAAVLDVHLQGKLVTPVAERLDREGIPLIFLSGSDAPGPIPPRFRERRVLAKPVEKAELLDAVEAALPE